MKGREPRFVGLDLHKKYIVVGAVNTHQQVVIHPHRVPTAKFVAWAQQHLGPSDSVALEAGFNSWHIYDVLQPLVARVVVAHPYQVKLIVQSFVKTDKRDALALARLLAANLLPEIWAPPLHVRQLRALVRHRQRLVSRRSAAKNQLRSLLNRHQIVPPGGDVFAPKQRTWWDSLFLSPIEALMSRQNLTRIDHLSEQIKECALELARQSVQPPWIEQTAFLIQLPGISLLNAMTILGAIGEITRFATPKKLVGYAGLGARVHASGETRRSGGITKQGRQELRTVMVEAAWVAVRYHSYWKRQFERLNKRMPGQKAIVAIARKLLVVVWYVLTDRVADRRADEQAVARSLLYWGADHRLATSQGLSRPEFVRRELDRLALGQGLGQFRFGVHTCHLPESELGADLPSDVVSELVQALAQVPA